jgi:hypothetical protein
MDVMDALALALDMSFGSRRAQVVLAPAPFVAEDADPSHPGPNSQSTHHRAPPGFPQSPGRIDPCPPARLLLAA